MNRLDTDNDRRLRPNLTSMESEALGNGLNAADGHPRMPLTRSQQVIVDDLASLFAEAEKRPFHEIEQEAHAAFLHGIGQASAPVGTGRLLSCYSSSVAMDIVARTLAERTSHVALVHPTFDNIPDLLKARGLRLVPLSEEEAERAEPDLGDEVGAVFVTTPNNPTGWVMSEAALRRLAGFCARSGRVLALDTCFRAQDTRAQYDTYRLLDESGVEWVVIEDTGKLWPMLELKAGFLAWGERTELRLEDAFSDVLLSISPLVLLLIARLAADAANGGYADLRANLERNREALAERLAGSPLTLTDPDARISVARVTLPDTGVGAEKFYQLMLTRGVHILPCDAFHWASSADGGRYVRVSLARGREEVEFAGRVLADVARLTASGAGN